MSPFPDPMNRPIPSWIVDPMKAAEYYDPDPDLITAMKCAVNLGAPLLLTGDPGTGKTQAAYYLVSEYRRQDPSRSFEVERFDVGSTTEAQDLFYRFNHVGYLHAAYTERHLVDPSEAKPLDATKFREKQAFARAIDRMNQGETVVLLVDEIDKAPTDFANDLLGVLDSYEKRIPETGEIIKLEDRNRRPILVITSNGERLLPEAFLRRCVFHHIDSRRVFTEDRLVDIVTKRLADSPRRDGGGTHRTPSRELVRATVQKFLRLREMGELKHMPSPAELIVWAYYILCVDQRTSLPDGWPHPGVLVKNDDDWNALQGAYAR